MLDRLGCSIYIETGTHHGQALREFILQQYQQDPPELVWVEPNPWQWNGSANKRKFPQFETLCTELPVWPSDLELIEARLFWPHKTMHLIADGLQLRWMSLMENGGVDDADLSGELKNTQRITRSLMTIRDYRRFGFKQNHFVPNLEAYEYHLNNHLIAWRLRLPQEVKYA